MAELNREQIRRLKLIRRLFYSSWLALGAFVLWLALTLPSRPSVILLVAAIPFGLRWYLTFLICPRCGHHFFMEQLDFVLPRFECGYCGLALRQTYHVSSN